MEKSVLSIPRPAFSKSLTALFSLMLLSAASVIAQPVLIETIGKTSHSFVNVNDKVYYASNDSLFTVSASGVTFIKKLNEKISSISEVTIGDKFVILTEPATGQQGLWVSTGTAASTIKVGTYPLIVPRMVYQNLLYLAINDGSHGIELWKLDAANSLAMVKDINPGTPNGFGTWAAYALTISNTQLFFIANDGAGSDIWKTDGTTSGTIKAVDVPFQSIEDLTDVNGTMYFEHDSVSSDYYDAYTELWKTQGTPATTQLVKDFDYNYQVNTLYYFQSFNGKLYFIHETKEGTNLMFSDGTSAGTQVVTEVMSGEESFFLDMIKFRNYLVWVTETQGFVRPIMKSDGTTAGTSEVHDLNWVYSPPSFDYSYIDLTPADDRLYFVDHATTEWPSEGEEYLLFESTPEYVNSTSKSMLERYNFPYNNTKNLTMVTGNDVVFTTWDKDENYYRLWYYDPDAQCAGTGALTREVWTNITGNKVSSIPVNTPPTYTQTVSEFKGPINEANNYGARYSGYLCVPATGNYKFMIASDDYSELYLSTSESKADKKLIAYVYGATRQNDFTKYPSQQSALIHLEKGTRYYIEALHKEGGTYDHIMVAMQYPSGAIENPILGSHLIPTIQNQPPTVNITEPTSSEVPANSSYVIKADASDPDGSIIRVEFSIKSLTYGWEDDLGTDSEAPYEAHTGVYGGSDFRIIVKAYDNTNGVAYDSMDVRAVECSATGKILHEMWTNVKGQSVTYIPVETPPTSSRTLSLFEAPTNVGDYYGARIRGYLCAPTDGEYTFYISSDDHSELWLSDGPNPANKKRIAYVQGATSKRQWNKYPSQQSVKIFLKRGVRYYVEALHKEHLGYDHIAVGWLLPNGVSERPIPGHRLSPFETSESMDAASDDEARMMTADESGMIEVAPNPVTAGKVILTSKDIEYERGSVMQVQLLSLTGEVVYSNKIECGGDCGSVELDFENRVRPGLYLLKGTDGKQSFTRRLIVK
jgi:ELWxxDGT repeat protein